MRPSAINTLVRHLHSVDWTKYTHSPNYDANISKIHKVLVESLDVYIPETTCSVNYKRIKREPWLTSGIQTSTTKAKLLYKQMQRKGCDDHCNDKYKTYNQMLTKVRRNAK